MLVVVPWSLAILQSTASIAKDEKTESPSVKQVVALSRKAADAAIDAKDYATAISKYKVALQAVSTEKDPNLDLVSEFHHRLALAYYRDGDYKEAEAHFDKSISALAPFGRDAKFDQACIQNNKAVSLAQSGDLQKALSTLRDVSSNLEAADKSKSRPAVFANINRASYNLRTNNAREAQWLLDQAKNVSTKSFPDYKEATGLCLLVDARLDQINGQLAKSKTKLQDAIGIEDISDDVKTVAKNNLANIQIEEERFDRAAELYDSARNLASDRKTMFEIEKNIEFTKTMKLTPKKDRNLKQLIYLDPNSIWQPVIVRGKRPILIPPPPPASTAPRQSPVSSLPRGKKF